MVYSNPAALWASEPLLVQKKWDREVQIHGEPTNCKLLRGTASIPDYPHVNRATEALGVEGIREFRPLSEVLAALFGRRLA